MVGLHVASDTMCHALTHRFLGIEDWRVVTLLKVLVSPAAPQAQYTDTRCSALPTLTLTLGGQARTWLAAAP